MIEGTKVGLVLVTVWAGCCWLAVLTSIAVLPDPTLQLVDRLQSILHNFFILLQNQLFNLIPLLHQLAFKFRDQLLHRVILLCFRILFFSREDGGKRLRVALSVLHLTDAALDPQRHFLDSKLRFLWDLLWYPFHRITLFLLELVKLSLSLVSLGEQLVPEVNVKIVGDVLYQRDLFVGHLLHLPNDLLLLLRRVCPGLLALVRILLHILCHFLTLLHKVRWVSKMTHATRAHLTKNWLRQLQGSVVLTRSGGTVTLLGLLYRINSSQIRDDSHSSPRNWPLAPVCTKILERTKDLLVFAFLWAVVVEVDLFFEGRYVGNFGLSSIWKERKNLFLYVAVVELWDIPCHAILFCLIARIFTS